MYRILWPQPPKIWQASSTVAEPTLPEDVSGRDYGFTKRVLEHRLELQA